MRLLVLSDSHGRRGALERAIAEQPAARHIFFLGDLVRDIEAVREFFPDRVFHIVTGNCDGPTLFPAAAIETVEQMPILYTHGHTFRVKSGTGPLLERAREHGCKIALFGHTHIPLLSYENGVYAVNPGSVGAARNGVESYAVIDIGKSGILPAILTMK